MKKQANSKSILSIDIGGSGIKASLVDQQGKIIKEYKKVSTPTPANPENVLKSIIELSKDFPNFDLVSVGFPGYVRDGIVHTAPNLDNEAWKMTYFNEMLSNALGKPSKVVNDADLQGLGIVKGTGLEMMMTLGTGLLMKIFQLISPNLSKKQRTKSNKNQMTSRS